jgi:nucleotide-binding universal stress UspA family protein
MKKILVPVDFSDASQNALNYVAELTTINGASLILLNVYRMPIHASAEPLMITADELEQASNQQLINLDNLLKRNYPQVKTELIAKEGLAVDVILDVIKSSGIESVVMGMKGHTNALDRLIGSISTTLMQKTKCPILVVPMDAKFQLPTNILMSCDRTKTVPSRALRAVKYFAKLFGAKINVLEIHTTKELVTQEKIICDVLIEHSLLEYDHVNHVRKGDDIAEELEKHMNMHKPDWLVLIPHQHSGLAGLFHKSFSKKMAFHSHIPVLSIHE